MVESLPTTAGGRAYILRVREPDRPERTVVPEMTPFVIGREDDCDLPLDDLQASRHHAQLEVQPNGRVVVRDLRSANGTVAGGERLPAGEGAWLAIPGTVGVGRTTILVEFAPAPDVAAAARPPAVITGPSRVPDVVQVPADVERAVREAPRWLLFSGAFMVATGLLAIGIALLLAMSRSEAAAMAPVVVVVGLVNLALGIPELVLARRIRKPDQQAWRWALGVVLVIDVLSGLSLLGTLITGGPTGAGATGLAFALAMVATGQLYRSRSWHRSA